MMKCGRRKQRFDIVRHFPIGLAVVICGIWILLIQAAAVESQEEKTKVTDIDPTVSEPAAPSDEETATESKTTAVPDDSVPVSVTDSPPTMVTTEDQSVLDTSTTASIVLETVNIVPSHVEPSETTTSLESLATETVTQSAAATDLPGDGGELHAEEIKQEETQTDSADEQLPVPDSFNDKQEGNQSTLPKQPNGLHDTESIKAQDEAETEDSKGTVGVEKKPEEKPEEEGLTFNEWTQKVLAEAEKDKQDAHSDSSSKSVPPQKQRKKKNYSSTECGAKVLAYNPEATNSKSVLNSNKDDYMINPCKVKKWFVIELCEPIQTQSVDIASLELFSSRAKSFKVFLSDRYPTKDWKLAGEFETEDERTVQTFPITQSHDYFAKFVRVELLDHYGNEHFCPITLFRVYGIAVIDYEEESPHDGESDDDPDEMDEDPRDGDEDSTNLFTSAKDTVINIVKKVLNVGPEDTDLPNVTGTNATVGMEVPDLNQSDSDVEMLPCLPDARAGEEASGHSVTMAPDTNRQMKPDAPEPGKTDDTVLVTKLDDDEQVETGNLPFDTLLEEETKMKMFRDYKNSCFLSGVDDGLGIQQRTSKLCYFLSLVSGKCMVDLEVKSPEMLHPHTSTDTGKLDVTDSSKSEISEATVAQSGEPEVSVTGKPEQNIDQSTRVSDTKIDQSHTDSFITTLGKQSTASSVDIKPTSVLEPIHQTDPPTFVEKLTDTQTGSTITDKSSMSQSHVVDSTTIDPSFTHETDQREATQAASGEATPSIPEDWKPTTEDVKVHGSVASEVPVKDQTQNGKMQPEASGVSDGTPLPDVPRDTPITVVTTDLPRPSESEPQGSSTEVPVVSVSDSQELTTDDAETKVTQDKQGDKTNATVVIQKSDSPGQDPKKLDLVKVPVIPVKKRESAIMRLSNRVKVLEQNVSLSSRFLEELSKRYKKQSEDMMKMLNRTLEKLTNVTVESEVKHKLHEVEMTEMERRMKNLTDVVNNLSLSLTSLNQQVKDRQMIWTSIVIMFIIVLFVFVNQRRKKDKLPTDTQQLLDQMPSEPKSGLSHRRNSISGPATPSKKKPILSGGSPLQRFNSETALDQDFPIIEPLLPIGHQVTDGVKKKKKKKQKQQECKVQSVVSPPGKECKMQPVIPPHTSPGENEPAKSSSSSLGLNFPGLFFFPSAKAVSDTGQQTAAKPKINQSEGKHAMSGVAATKSSSQVVGGEASINRKGVGGEFSKRPPLVTEKSSKAVLKMAKSHDLSGSDKMSQRISPSTSRKLENAGVKGHRRQRSLPKQHYSMPETREIEISQVKPKQDHVENGGHEFHGVQDLPVKGGGMKKSTSMPTSHTKRPHVVGRKSLESIGKTAAVKSGTESESWHCHDIDGCPVSKTGKNPRNRSTDHNLDFVNGSGLHGKPKYSNGWDPGKLNDDCLHETKLLNVGNEQRNGKLKAWPDRGRASSLDVGSTISKSFCDTACNGELTVQGNVNGTTGINGDANKCSIDGPSHDYYDSVGTKCGPRNLHKKDEPGENQSRSWKKMFGLFR